ncbi:MAG: 23S rRNA (guanosine(2251)-2'-O)-methyltransferase RlmB [Actinomycetota bacterium]
MRLRANREENILPGPRAVAEALRAGTSIQRVLLAQRLRPSPGLAEIRRLANEGSIPIRVVPTTELDRLARGVRHQGVVAVTAPFNYSSFGALLHGESAALLFLDGVSDPQNLGSLIRSAECAGFSGVVIPTHRSAGVTATVRRVSAGAAEVIPVARVTNLGRSIEAARESGLWVIGLDERAHEDIWSSDLLETPVGLVLGAEGKGISPGVRGHCDGFVRIPVGGQLSSLNVGVAGALAMFEVARKRIRAGADTLTPGDDDRHDPSHRRRRGSRRTGPQG